MLDHFLGLRLQQRAPDWCPRHSLLSSGQIFLKQRSNCTASLLTHPPGHSFAYTTKFISLAKLIRPFYDLVPGPPPVTPYHSGTPHSSLLERISFSNEDMLFPPSSLVEMPPPWKPSISSTESVRCLKAAKGFCRGSLRSIITLPGLPVPRWLPRW